MMSLYSAWKRGKEIIKNKLMRGIHYSINASIAPVRAYFSERNKESRGSEKKNGRR